MPGTRHDQSPSSWGAFRRVFVNLTATHAPFAAKHREETVPERDVFSGVPFSSRLKWSVAIAVVLAVAVMPLARECGNIHGSPTCGVLTVFALLFVVPALVVESWLFTSPLNTWSAFVFDAAGSST